MIRFVQVNKQFVVISSLKNQSVIYPFIVIYSNRIYICLKELVESRVLGIETQPLWNESNAISKIKLSLLAC